MFQPRPWERWLPLRRTERGSVACSVGLNRLLLRLRGCDDLASPSKGRWVWRSAQRRHTRRGVLFQRAFGRLGQKVSVLGAVAGYTSQSAAPSPLPRGVEHVRHLIFYPLFLAWGGCIIEVRQGLSSPLGVIFLDVQKFTLERRINRWPKKQRC